MRSRRTGPGLLGAGGFGEIYLETPELTPGNLAVELEGLDTGAPRQLEIWQVDEDGVFVLLGKGRSDEDGSLDLPRLMPTPEARDILISPAGNGPAGLERSQPRVLERSGVNPPQLGSGPASEARSSVRVVAGESSGAVLLLAESGAVVARLELPAIADPRRGIFDVPLNLGPGATVFAAHQLPNGDLSPTVSYRIERQQSPIGAAGMGGILEDLAR